MPCNVTPALCARSSGEALAARALPLPTELPRLLLEILPSWQLPAAGTLTARSPGQ